MVNVCDLSLDSFSVMEGLRIYEIIMYAHSALRRHEGVYSIDGFGLKMDDNSMGLTEYALQAICGLRN